MPVLTTSFIVAAAAAVFSTSTLSGATLLTIIAIRRGSNSTEPRRDTGIDALIEQLCKEDEEDEAASRRAARKSAKTTKQTRPLYSNAISASPGSYDSTKSPPFHVNLQSPTSEKAVTKRTQCTATTATRTTARTLSSWSARTSTSSRSSISTHSSSKFAYKSRSAVYPNDSLSSRASSASRWAPPTYLTDTEHLNADEPTVTSSFASAPVTVYAPGLDFEDVPHAHSNHRLSLRVDDEDLVPALEQPAPPSALPHCICHVLGRQPANAPWRGCMEHVPTQLV